MKKKLQMKTKSSGWKYSVSFEVNNIKLMNQRNTINEHNY